ncbi:hypothetical protein EJB05_21794, partial [Eragrostis curvula]
MRRRGDTSYAITFCPSCSPTRCLVENINSPSPTDVGSQCGRGSAPARARQRWIASASRLRPVWSGRLWGRTLCSSDAARHLSVLLAEFTLDGSGGMDFYDMSLVDGYNMSMLVAPQGATVGSNCVPRRPSSRWRVASPGRRRRGV